MRGLVSLESATVRVSARWACLPLRWTGRGWREEWFCSTAKEPADEWEEGERRAKDLVYGLIPSLREMVTSVTLPPGCLCETQGLTETGRFGVCRCPGSSAPWTASGSARVQVPAVMGQWMAREGSVRTDRRSRARRS